MMQRNAQTVLANKKLAMVKAMVAKKMTERIPGRVVVGREKYTPLGQSSTAPNIMNAQRVIVEQEARAIQLRNLLGTGRQLVTEGNRPIISGGGTVLRVGSEVSPSLMDRIRLAERGPVPDSFIGTEGYVY